jgi:DNA-binding NarL/FixJ family response regulator
VAAAAVSIQFTVALVSYRHAEPDLLYLNWVVVVTALGLFIRERRERIATAEQRAEAAERSRQAEADRQVTAERIRIAHELHDVLAHHIAVVNAQAGVAQYLLRTDPQAADTALAGIAANSRAALDELRVTLGLLRAEGDTAPGDPRAPAPTIEHLGLLLDSFTDAGMRLTVAVHGDPGSLSGPADLAFYRIVQEALTNATKHAPSSDVSLGIDWSPASVHLIISNTEPATFPQALMNEGTGHGLIGMRERSAAAGGTLSAGPIATGGYRVMDIRMPEVDGIQATRDITTAAGLSHVKIIMLTTFETDELIVDALRAGASGYLGKGVEPEKLLGAIRDVAAGDSLLSPTATRALIARVLAQPSIGPARTPAALAELTPREREILALVASGLSNDDIAANLVISPATAKTHVNRTMMKLSARDRAQLVIIAYETGLITPGRKPE